MKRVFFDLDETLIRSFFPAAVEWDRADFNFFLENGENYGVYVRPMARELIAYAKTLVGEEVYVLTKASLPYALEVVKLGGLGIDPARIYDRGLIDYAKGCVEYPFKDGQNILIDDFPHTHKNIIEKMDFLKIRGDSFLQIPAFQLGNEVTNQMFYFKARAFIKEKALT